MPLTIDFFFLKKKLQKICFWFGVFCMKLDVAFCMKFFLFPRVIMTTELLLAQLVIMTTELLLAQLVIMTTELLLAQLVTMTTELLLAQLVIMTTELLLPQLVKKILLSKFIP